jgi:hypothetical protein
LSFRIRTLPGELKPGGSVATLMTTVWYGAATT